MVTTSFSLLDRLRHPETDGQAWDRFVSLYSTLIYYWATSWCLQSADASDLTQDVLLVVFRELPDYQRTANIRFRSWLYTIARNRLRSHCRKRNPLPIGGDFGDDEPTVPDQLAGYESAEELALLTRRAAELLQQDFKPSTWKAFWETAVEGRSSEEVATALGMTAGAVRVARFRVQARIRQDLAGFLD